MRNALERIAELLINRIDEFSPWAVAGQSNAALAEQILAA